MTTVCTTLVGVKLPLATGIPSVFVYTSPVPYVRLTLERDEVVKVVYAPMISLEVRESYVAQLAAHWSKYERGIEEFALNKDVIVVEDVFEPVEEVFLEIPKPARI